MGECLLLQILDTLTEKSAGPFRASGCVRYIWSMACICYGVTYSSCKHYLHLCAVCYSLCSRNQLACLPHSFQKETSVEWYFLYGSSVYLTLAEQCSSFTLRLIQLRIYNFAYPS